MNSVSVFRALSRCYWTLFVSGLRTNVSVLSAWAFGLFLCVCWADLEDLLGALCGGSSKDLDICSVLEDKWDVFLVTVHPEPAFYLLQKGHVDDLFHLPWTRRSPLSRDILYNQLHVSSSAVSPPSLIPDFILMCFNIYNYIISILSVCCFII